MGELQNEDGEEEERSEKLCRTGGGGGGWDGGELLKGSPNAEIQQKPDQNRAEFILPSTRTRLKLGKNDKSIFCGIVSITCSYTVHKCMSLLAKLQSVG